MSSPEAAAAAIERPQLADLPEFRGSILSRVTYSWMDSFMYRGWKNPLNESDLYNLDSRLESSTLQAEFNKHIEAEMASPNKSLFRAIRRTVGRGWLVGAFFRVISSLALICYPLVIQQLIRFVQDSHDASNRDEAPSAGKGYGLAVGLFAMLALETITFQLGQHAFFSTGYKIRNIIIAQGYKKMLTMSNAARQQLTSGVLLNIISTDSGRLEQSALTFVDLFLTPVMVGIVTGFLIKTLGVSALAGTSLLLVYGPIQSYFMNRLAGMRGRAIVFTDRRVRMVQETLKGIRVLKFRAWEADYVRIISDLRSQELRLLRNLQVYRSILAAISSAIPALAIVITFVVYAALGNELTADKMFTGVAMFGSIQNNIVFYTRSIAVFIDGKVSLERVSLLLFSDDSVASIEELQQPTTEKKDQSALAVELTNATFKWPSTSASGAPSEDAATTVANEKIDLLEKSDEASVSSGNDGDFVLRNINLHVQRGSLVAIVGKIGSGKTALLSALVGEMDRISGSMSINGSLAYCTQQSWIQNATVRDNILFGRPYDEERYRKVIKICALERDLKTLPDGDNTEIGERGSNLSGGQKQRLSLARAVYFDPEIILFDDPLSAVDTHVGRHLFYECISGDMLQNKTRLLVTHQLHFAKEADRIVYLENGRIAEDGTYDDLMSKNGAFAAAMREHSGDGNDTDADSIEASGTAPSAVDKREQEQQHEQQTTAAADGLSKDGDNEKGKLMVSEERETGAVSFKVYKAFFNYAGGFTATALIFGALVLTQVTRVMTDLWLNYWIEHRWGKSDHYFMSTYAVWGVAQGLTQALFMMCLVFACMLAAKRLHNAAVKSVYMSPISWFDTTSQGLITNRLSKDVDSVDTMFTEIIRMLLSMGASTLASLIFTATIVPWLLLPLAVMAVAYYFISSFYRATSRELKRLDSITRSPLFAHISETLTGLSVIRAFGVQNEFIRTNLNHMDNNNRANYMTIAIMRWLQLRLELLANSVGLFTAIFAVTSRFSIDPGLIGIILSYASSITAGFSMAIRFYVDLEVQMNSVERLEHFVNNLKHEHNSLDDFNNSNKNDDSAWKPTSGAIEFSNVEMRYRPGLPLVLKSLSLSIKAGERIGIVGRSGCGKSSTIHALFRFSELDGGFIQIDGADISTIGLTDLRSKLAIIPQEATLFHGTFRSNLDPSGRHSDDELWSSLERVGLRDFVSSIQSGLDGEVTEGGDNLSTGQRQLVCLARALLGKSKIVILDEATASVDTYTDVLVQKVLRTDLAGCTILAIAHRLNTIIDYDRIMVLDNGILKEFDTPAKLLGDPNSEFSKLVDETGPANAAYLRSVAAQNPDSS
ncbi:P-loop containing nucleoside triphosphate hydrolase protein [Ramicandelaber brevisporus]|nr:P-loop containing nucleoside triphosphate hydrolase protein [Ramicandelaber brevisporus]